MFIGRFLCALLFLNCLFLRAQDKPTYELFLDKLKKFELDSIPFYLEDFPEGNKKKLLLSEYKYQKYGIVNTDFFENPGSLKKLDAVDSILFLNYLGDYYVRIPVKQYDKSFNNHLRAFDLAKRQNNNLLINKSLTFLTTH